MQGGNSAFGAHGDSGITPRLCTGREFNHWFSKDLIAKESFMKKVIICAEASALHLKKAIVDFLSGEGYDFTDATSRDDLSYIEAGSTIGESISNGEYSFGIVMCGSGMGVNLVANRYSGVYCGLCESLHTAKMARTITNCNVLALGGNIVAHDLACRMVKAFLDTEFGETFPEETAAALKNMFEEMDAVDRKTHEAAEG